MKRRGQGDRRKISLLGIFFQLLPFAGLAAVFAVVGVVHVTSRVMSVGIGYRLSTLESEVRGLGRDADQLKLELAILKSPARLEKIARGQLGMVPPSGGAIISIGPPGARLGRVAVGEASAAGPAQMPVKVADRSSPP
jgi:cell division protein FtsL